MEVSGRKMGGDNTAFIYLKVLVNSLAKREFVPQRACRQKYSSSSEQVWY